MTPFPRRMAPERHGRHFVVLGQGRRARFLRPGLHALGSRAFPHFATAFGLMPNSRPGCEAKLAIAVLLT